MFERMLDKNTPPEEEAIESYIGEEALGYLRFIEAGLEARYSLRREMRFPFGNSYGWGYKYSHLSKHLLYIFFEKGAVTATLQVGDNEIGKLNALLPTLLPKTRALWEKRYPCGDNGGWVHYRLHSAEEAADILKLVEVKKKPAK